MFLKLTMPNLLEYKQPESTKQRLCVQGRGQFCAMLSIQTQSLLKKRKNIFSSGRQQLKKNIKKNNLLVQASFVSVQIWMKPSLVTSWWLNTKTTFLICVDTGQPIRSVIVACLHTPVLGFLLSKVKHLGKVTQLHLPWALEEAALYQQAGTAGQQANND